jgi:hypothetical protein
MVSFKITSASQASSSVGTKIQIEKSETGIRIFLLKQLNRKRQDIQLQNR